MLVLAAALALGACGGRAGAPRERGRPIVLITIDTLRPDHLGAYGYRRDTSPRIDALARRSVVFRNVVSQWPATSPSMASLFTSSYVHASRVVRRTRGFVLPDEAETLAEVLAAHGYQTAAVSANGALSPDYNFHQGFARFLLPYRVHPELAVVESVRADHTTDLALEALRGLDTTRPFLLWVHYLDPHMSYGAPEPWRGRFLDEPSDDQLLVSCSPLNWGGREHRGGARRCPRSRLVARYDGEVAFVDHELGRLLDGLEQAGVLDRALTVLTADHGEALGEERGYFGHSRSVRQSEVRVPLLFHLAGGRGAGRVVEAPVDLVDLAPTVLALVGLERGAAMHGDDLSGLVAGDRPGEAPRYAFTEAGTSDNYMRAVVGERYKVIHVPDRRERRIMAGTPIEVYDLVTDPLETRNLWPERQDVVDQYLPVLDAWRAEGARPDGAPAPEEGEGTPETIEQLRSLGYLGE